MGGARHVVPRGNHAGKKIPPTPRSYWSEIRARLRTQPRDDPARPGGTAEASPSLPKTLVLLVLTGILVSAAWLRVEQTEPHRREAALMVALGFLPALALTFGQGRLSRRALQLTVGAVGVLAALLAASAAFDLPLRYAQPFDGEHDFFGPMFDSLGQGFLDFYEAELPFDP